MLDGRGGNDILVGGVGDDVYWFDYGSGIDCVYDYDVVYGVDYIEFGLGVMVEEVVVFWNGDDFELRLSVVDSIIFVNWFVGEVYCVESVKFSDG